MTNNTTNRQIVGSYHVAKYTISFFEDLIETSDWRNAREAISVIHKIGNILTQAQPIGFNILFKYLEKILITFKKNYVWEILQEEF